MTAFSEPELRPAPTAEGLLRGAATAARRGAERLRVRLDDLKADTGTRLDDRIRALLDHQLTGITEAIEAELRQSAAGLLLARGERDLAARVREGRGAVAGLRHDSIVAELLARLRHDLIAANLPLRAGEGDEASLLVRLSDVTEPQVAAAARALLVADSRRREALDFAPVTASDLSAELHQQLVWLVAACMREAGADALDRALGETAARLLAAHDEGERAESAAMRLALAIDARPNELPALIDEALADRRLSLVVAVLAQAAQVPFDDVRGMLIEPDDERWWLLLRAVGLDAVAMARIALALAQADPRRETQALPDLLDAINAVDLGAARAALAPLRLPAGFRAAVEALAEVGG